MTKDIKTHENDLVSPLKKCDPGTFHEIEKSVAKSLKDGLCTSEVLKAQENLNEISSILKDTAKFQKETAEVRVQLSKHVQNLRKDNPIREKSLKRGLLEGEKVIINGESFIFLRGALHLMLQNNSTDMNAGIASGIAQEPLNRDSMPDPKPKGP